VLGAHVSAAWEAEIGRITVQGQSWQIVHQTLSPELTRAKWSAQAVSNSSPTKKKKSSYIVAEIYSLFSCFNRLFKTLKPARCLIALISKFKA
jgi:hypothetical protein